jgi:hypothetical protein
MRMVVGIMDATGIAKGEKAGRVNGATGGVIGIVEVAICEHKWNDLGNIGEAEASRTSRGCLQFERPRRESEEHCC